jgi:hypothetical protein
MHTVRVWRSVLTDAPSVHSVGVVLSDDLNDYVMWKGHRMNRRLEKDSIGSFDAYFFSGR